jgi:hypothetical protein
MVDVKVEKSPGSMATAMKRTGRFHPRNNISTAQPKFEGRCDEIKGFTWDCADGRNTDRYNISTKEIAQCMGHIYTYGGDVRWTIDNEPKFTVSVPPDGKIVELNATAKHIWEKRIDEYCKRDLKLAESCEKLYSSILEQCTEYMKVKLEELKHYYATKSEFDVIMLIKAIKGLMYQFEGQKYHSHALKCTPSRKKNSTYYSRPKTCPMQSSLRTSKPSSQ